MQNPYELRPMRPDDRRRRNADSAFVARGHRQRSSGSSLGTGRPDTTLGRAEGTRIESPTDPRHMRVPQRDA